MSHKKRADLIVVGGGVIGLAIAIETARRGIAVTLLERSVPGRGSTWAAAGMLSPLGEARDRGPFLDFALESLQMYRSWAESLNAASGLSFDYSERGKLHCARSESESVELERRLRWAQREGIRAESLSREDLRKVVPGISESFDTALLVHDDFRVDNRRLVDALLVSLRRAGVRVRVGARVEGAVISEGRIVGLTLESGERIEGGSVILAAGAWSAGVRGLPRPPEVHPVRGQMLALVPSVAPSTRVLESEDIYLVPREDGRLLVGATVEEVGFDDANTAGGIHRLLSGAIDLIPRLESARVGEIWAGLRPGTADELPIIGPDPEVEGLIHATGHFRNGILLAPLTARIVADLVEDHAAASIPPAFLPGRPFGTQPSSVSC